MLKKQAIAWYREKLENALHLFSPILDPSVITGNEFEEEEIEDEIQIEEEDFVDNKSDSEEEISDDEDANDDETECF